MFLLGRMPNATCKLSEYIERTVHHPQVSCQELPTNNKFSKCGGRILYFRVDDLAHDNMSRVSGDIKCRGLDMTLLWQRPLVVLVGQLGQRILVFCSGDDGLESLRAVLGLGSAGDARNPSQSQFGMRKRSCTLLVPTSTSSVLGDGNVDKGS